MDVKELLPKTPLSRSECYRCGSEYRGGYTYRGIPICGKCARRISDDLRRTR